MSGMNSTPIWLTLIGLSLTSGSVGQASVLYDVSMNTTPLIGHVAGPFALEFQLNDGSGTGDANNTASLSSFTFGGGTATGNPTLVGGAAGSLSSAVTLTDSSFFNQFIQKFTPGDRLEFQLSLSNNAEGRATPDEFSFAILDHTGTEIPTLAGSLFDVFVSIDITPSHLITSFAGDVSREPAGGGAPINISAPQVTPVPESSAWALLASGLGAICLIKSRMLR